MKTATVPCVHIEPLFRADMEHTLEADERLAPLVQTAVRHEVARRRTPSEFVRQGITALQRTVDAGDGIPAAAVIARLQHKLAAARAKKRT